MPESKKLIIIGGGIAGIGSALAAREINPHLSILMLEKGNKLMSWMDRKGLNSYPVCSNEIQTDIESGPQYLRNRLLENFDPGAIINWLTQSGVKFETTEGQVLCLDLQSLQAAFYRLLEDNGIDLEFGYALESISRQPNDGIRIWSSDGVSYQCSSLILATGGERNHAMKIARETGADVDLPIPAFTRLKLFNPKLGDQLRVRNKEVRIKCLKSESTASGKIDVSSRGLEGPVVSRLSALECRLWNRLNYSLQLEIDWMPEKSSSVILKDIIHYKASHGKRSIPDNPMYSFSNRFWEALLSSSRIDTSSTWGRLKMKKLQALANRLKSDRINVAGMGLPAQERACSGGIALDGINQQTFESKTMSGLYFAGEILNLHGFPEGDHQNLMWSSAFLAGRSAASES